MRVALVAAIAEARLVRLARPGRDGGPPNNWRGRVRRRRPGRSTRRPGSGTCTSSCPSSPTSTGRNPEVVDGACTTCCASGSTAASTASASTSSTDRQGPGAPRPAGRARRSSTASASTTSPRRTSCLRGIRRLLDAYPGDRMMVGEVYLGSTGRRRDATTATATSCTSLQLPAAVRAVGRPRWRDAIERVERDARRRTPGRPGCSRTTTPAAAAPATAVGGRGARAAAVLLLTLRGTPFLYAGRGARARGRGRAARAPVSTRAAATAAGRRSRGSRRPATAGRRRPWLPWPPAAGRAQRRVAAGRSGVDAPPLPRPAAARRASPALRRGTRAAARCARRCARLRARAGDDRRLVLVNFSERPVDVPLAEPWRVEVASAAQRDAGSLPPLGAALLRPAAL